MININFGHNKDLLEKCAPLYGYSEFTSKILEYKKDHTIDEAIDLAIAYCIASNNPIAQILDKQRTEVKSMLDTEYNEDEIRELFKAEGKEEGKAEGKAEGIIQTAINMIKKGLDLSVVSECTDLDLDTLTRLKLN